MVTVSFQCHEIIYIFLLRLSGTWSVSLSLEPMTLFILTFPQVGGLYISFYLSNQELPVQEKSDTETSIIISHSVCVAKSSSISCLIVGNNTRRCFRRKICFFASECINPILTVRLTICQKPFSFNIIPHYFLTIVGMCAFRISTRIFIRLPPLLKLTYI